MITDRPRPQAVLFFILDYHPVIGGTERQLQTLCKHWSTQGQDIWVLTRAVPGCAPFEVVDGVKVFRLRIWWVPGFSTVFYALRALGFAIRHHRDIDSFWSMMLNATTWAAVLCGKLLRRPVVIKLVSSGSGGNIRTMERSRLGKLKTKFLLKGCRAVVAMNHEMIEELRPYELAPGRIRLIQNGVDAEVFHPVDPLLCQGLRRRYGFRDEDLISVFVGRYQPEKNLLNLLTAWSDVAAHCPNGRLLLVGEGPLLRDLQAWIADHGLQESVRLQRARQELVELYQLSDVFLLPSLFEGLSNALLEAMACGLPVIVSQIAGNTAVLQESGLGGLIDPNQPRLWAEPWRKLLEDPPLRHELGARARQWIVQRFSIQKTLNAYRSLHEEVVR